jgi:HEPN superfamily AbiU2-like protein
MYSALTEQKFWEHLQSVSAEVDDALAVFHTYDEILRLGSEDDTVFRAFNANAMFWNVQKLSLQTTIFVALNRLFETDANALSIHRLLNETLAHPEFFSKDALRRRKIDLKIAPEYLDALIDGVWAPADASELRYLKKELKPHFQKFMEIYQPIRHYYYAHRLLQTDKPVAELFSLTNRNELRQILDFLHQLVRAICDLYQNGRKPEFPAQDIPENDSEATRSVREVINKVAGLQPTLDE